MPETIGALILAIFDVSATAGFTIAGVTITYASIIGATVLAAASLAVSSSLMPSSGAANVDGQLTLQQPIPFRRRGYGRMKLGGYFIFWTSARGTLYQLVAILAHQVDGFEQFWVSDRKVALDGSGNVTSVIAPAGADPNQFNPSGVSKVQIVSRLGAPGQVASSILEAAFPGVWTSAHVGVGIADILMVEKGVTQNNFSSVYPGGQQTIRTVLRGALIYDPRDVTQHENDPSTWKWSDNAAVVLLDYLTHEDGWRIAKSVFLTGMAEAITLAAMNICDELVALKSGGSESRYRIWGFYDFSQEPRAVLALMLAACGGWLQPQPDGTIAIRAGKWVAPDFTIIDDMILGFDVQHFVGEFDAVNEVRATFNDPDNDYQQTETAPWQNEADIQQRGYIKSTTVDARYCPSFTQARRIQKIAYNEASPEFSITLTTNSAGLGGRNRKFINLEMNQLGISGPFRVTSFVANLQTGVCTIGLASFSPASYDWDDLTEEGDPPPIPPDSASAGTVETPTGLTVSVETSIVSGSTVGAIMVISCDAPVFRTDLTVKFEYQVDGTDSWTISSQGTQTYQTETPILSDGTYNVRASFISASGVQGNFEIVSGVVVSASAAAPAMTNSLMVLAGSPSSHANVFASSPNDPNFAAVRFWRNSVNTFSSSTNVGGAIYGAPNQSFEFEDAPGSGTWYYWATAESPTGSRSAPEGSVSITL